MSDEHGIAAGIGGFDLHSMLEAAQGMQAKMQEAAATLAATVVEGSAGGGAVRVEVNGAWDFRGVHLDASVVDPTDVSMLEDLLLAALRDAATKVVELNEQANPLGGVDLGPLGGFLGGG